MNREFGIDEKVEYNFVAPSKLKNHVKAIKAKMEKK